MFLYSTFSRTARILEGAGANLLQLRKKTPANIIQNPAEFIAGQDPDTNSENFIVSRLKRIKDLKQFNPLIYSEGSPIDILGKDGIYWIVDPVDGTDNYVYGEPYWGVSIALLWQGRVVLAGICLPSLKKELVFSLAAPDIKDKDAPFRSHRLAKNIPSMDRGNERVFIDWSKISPLATAAVFKDLSNAGFRPQTRGCSSAIFLGVVSGAIGAYVAPEIALEDRVAGAWLVRMCGGKVTDFRGNPWGLNSTSLIASHGNEEFHERILKALN